MSEKRMTENELLEELAETNAKIDEMVEEIVTEGITEEKADEPEVNEETEERDEEPETTEEAEVTEETKAEADVEEVEARANALIAKKENLIEEIQARKENAEVRKDMIEEIASGKGKVIKSLIERETKMTNMEIRNSSEYINAFANYIKTGDDKECRALLTENVKDGTVPVPEVVEGYIRTAWENAGIMSRVDKSFIRGNLKVGFEISATDAVAHEEGDGAVTEEELVLGTVEMIPQSIKKWISISDEALDLGGEAFLAYIYDEIAQKIAKKADDIAVYEIINSPAVSTAGAPGVAAVESELNATAIIQALGNISDEATNPVVILNKATWAAFKSITTDDGYLIADPFAGMDVIFNNSIDTYDEAEEGGTYAIVGDLGTGIKANFPNGEEITFKFDDLSLAEYDLVKIVGRMFAAINVVAPYRFAKIVKPEASA